MKRANNFFATGSAVRDADHPSSPMAFIAAHQVRQKAEDGRQLCRFAKSEKKEFPTMIEIFSRKPEGIDLGEGQHIVPVSSMKIPPASPRFC
jgi:hypothetical protein